MVASTTLQHDIYDTAVSEHGHERCGLHVRLTAEDDPGCLEGRLDDAQLEVGAQQAQQVMEVGDRQLGVPQYLHNVARNMRLLQAAAVPVRGAPSQEEHCTRCSLAGGALQGTQQSGQPSAWPGTELSEVSTLQCGVRHGDNPLLSSLQLSESPSASSWRGEHLQQQVL